MYRFDWKEILFTAVLLFSMWIFTFGYAIPVTMGYIQFCNPLLFVFLLLFGLSYATTEFLYKLFCHPTYYKQYIEKRENGVVKNEEEING